MLAKIEIFLGVGLGPDPLCDGVSPGYKLAMAVEPHFSMGWKGRGSGASLTLCIKNVAPEQGTAVACVGYAESSH